MAEQVIREATPRSNALFSAIVATVAATTERRLTVHEIAVRVGTSDDVTAQCIALHRYFRAHSGDIVGVGALSVPTPADFTIPRAEDVIDEAALGLG